MIGGIKFNGSVTTSGKPVESPPVLSTINGILMNDANPTFYFRAILFAWAMVIVPVSSTSPTAWGDGPADNLPDQVRPIPPAGIQIPDATAEALAWRCTAIRAEWNALLEEAGKQADAKKTPKGRSDVARLRSLTAEILVFPRAVELAIEFHQFYKPVDPEKASRLLDEANRRIQIVRRGGDWGEVVGLGDGSSQRLIIGGYRSKIDGSYQPYGLVIPPGFGRFDVRPRRLDLWFHGRGETLSEVAFLSNQSTSPGRYTPADTFVLHPYGRYSNAFKFAGEIDVLEVLDYIRSRLPVDENRIAVRGFSMGGAACWQFATHYADRWFAANPGAGFSETPQFLTVFQMEDVSNTPLYQKKLWQLYDCPPWAGNLQHCPMVAYSGEIDRQKQAADVMEAALEERGIDLVHIIGPQTAHKIHPRSMIEIESRMAALAHSASARAPMQIDFTTVSLRYHKMHWIDVQGLGEHWTPANVQASIQPPSTIEVATDNVTDLRIRFDPGQWPGSGSGPITVKIGDAVIEGPAVASDRSWSADLTHDGTGWKIGRRGNSLRKRPGLQGPIDDALMDSFLFVLPTSQSDDPAVQAWIESESEHAMTHWRKHFRGDIRYVLDSELTLQQILSNHLILFGDHQSNRIIQKIAGDLPLQWDAQTIKIGSEEVPSGGHVPIMIYPNPMNPDRYVVLNSGFTFREYDYLNNARQTPKLPDWALVDIREGATTQSPGVIQAAGFFDESWMP